MKHHLYICVAALLLAGAAPMQAQKKTQAKSKGKGTTTKTNILYVEPEERNYAQNLGGHMFWDYTAKEGNGLQTDFKKLTRICPYYLIHQKLTRVRK